MNFYEIFDFQCIYLIKLEYRPLSPAIDDKIFTVISLFLYLVIRFFRLSFSDFLQSAVSYRNWCKLFTCHHNLICFFSCRTLNDFNKISVIIFICNEWKQMNWPYKQNYVKTLGYFYRKLYDLFFKCRKNCKRAETGI